MKVTHYILMVFISSLLFSCEKEIDVDLPRPEEKLVVEGVVETGAFPYVVLSKTSPYFDPTDVESVANSYVSEATITLSDGVTTTQMTRLCSGTLTEPQKDQLSIALGIPRQVLGAYNICGFTDLTRVGEVGKTYTIAITWKGEVYESSTTILNPVPLDSTWFEVYGNRDSLGFIYANLTEPANEINYYRWFARRINTYKSGPLKGQVKDNSFLPPTNSVFDDEFVNGTTFEFGYNRPSTNGNPDDSGPERSLYKDGDTVVVKFCNIDKSVYDFIDGAEEQIISTGSPFATPTNVFSNISNGGLGLWAGYSPYNDTIFCNK
jgi:hypothetical protein